MNRSGMTLVELLVAITITGVLLSAAYTAYGAIADINKRTSREYRALQKQTAIRRTIEDWLMSAKSDSAGHGFEIVEDGHDGNGNDQIHFDVTRADPFFTRAARIALYIDHDPATPETGLVASLRDRANGMSQTVEIAPEADALELTMLPVSGSHDTWIRPSALGVFEKARAVQLTIAGRRLPELLMIPFIAGSMP